MVRLLRVAMNTNRRLQLYTTNHTTLLTSDSVQLAEVTISDSSQASTSSNNLLAYRPRFGDLHGSGLGAIFINLEAVYPCLAQLSGYRPLCSTLTEEEDGFRDGRALIDAGDIGNNIQVFTGSNQLTYGIAIQQCPELNTTCLPVYHSFSVVCYLPRGPCA